MNKEFISLVNKLEDDGDVTQLWKMEVELREEIKKQRSDELVEKLNYVRDAVNTILFFKP